MTAKKHKSSILDEKEVYILKIYRRGEKPLNALVGTIEDIRGKKKGTFNNQKGLVSWLTEKKS